MPCPSNQPSLLHFPKLNSLLCLFSSYVKGHPSLLVPLSCYVLFLVLLYSLKNYAARIASVHASYHKDGLRYTFHSFHNNSNIPAAF